MDRIEAAFAALETRVADAQKASDDLSRALKAIRKAAQEGHVANIEKGLAAIAERGRESEAAARSLSGAWNFDARGYLEEGYGDELREEAGAQGVSLFERDGRFYAFPLLVKVEAREGGVRIAKKLVRAIRPKHLVRLCRAFQKRPQVLKGERFLGVLYDVYRQIAGGEWRAAERGPAISLADIHAVLTLLPGADYTIQEFGRDLLLLDRQPDLRTRDGSAFEFAGSTLSKGAMKRIVVYDESGNERTYIAIRFVKAH